VNSHERVLKIVKKNNLNSFAEDSKGTPYAIAVNERWENLEEMMRMVAGGESWALKKGACSWGST
jgi:hypothetical protein